MALMQRVKPKLLHNKTKITLGMHLKLERFQTMQEDSHGKETQSQLKLRVERLTMQHQLLLKSSDQLFITNLFKI